MRVRGDTADQLRRLDQTRDHLLERMLTVMRALIQVEDQRGELIEAWTAADSFPVRGEENALVGAARQNADIMTGLLVSAEQLDRRGSDPMTAAYDAGGRLR